MRWRFASFAASAGLSAAMLVAAPPMAAQAQPVPSVLSVAPGTQYPRLPTNQRVVALTFDTGTDGSGVPSIINTLEREGVPATFFMVGYWMQRFPDLTRQIAANPNFALGNHSQNHPFLTRVSDATVSNEVTQADNLAQSLTGRSTQPLFRFPYGDYNSHTINLVNSLGYASITWTVDTQGWQGGRAGQSVGSVVSRAVGAATPGEIVLMHTGAAADGSTLDSDALPQIISELRARGYGFVALDRALGASNLSKPTVGTNRNGTLQTFATTGSGRIMTNGQAGPSQAFGGWEDMGFPAQAVGAPTVGVNQDGRLQVFVRTTDNRLLTSWQRAPNGVFGGWADLGLAGQIASDPTLGLNSVGTLQVFVQGTGGRILTTWQGGPNQGFGGWVDMSASGLVAGVPGVGVNQDGRLQVFAHTTDNRLLTSWQGAPSQAFGGWADLGSGGQIVSDPTLGPNSIGTLQIFVHATGGRILTTWQGGPNQGFGGWLDMGVSGPATGAPGTGVNQDGRLQVFVRTTDNRLLTSWQGAPSQAFGGWADLGSGGQIVSDPTLGVNSSGAMEIFVESPDWGVLTTWQGGPNQGFGGWLDMGVPAS